MKGFPLTDARVGSASKNAEVKLWTFSIPQKDLMRFASRTDSNVLKFSDFSRLNGWDRQLLSLEGDSTAEVINNRHLLGYNLRNREISIENFFAEISFTNANASVTREFFLKINKGKGKGFKSFPPRNKLFANSATPTPSKDLLGDHGIPRDDMSSL